MSMIPTLVGMPDLGCSEGCTLVTSPMGLLHGRTHPQEAEDVGLMDQVTTRAIMISLYTYIRRI